MSQPNRPDMDRLSRQVMSLQEAAEACRYIEAAEERAEKAEATVASLTAILTGLYEVYKPEGVGIWLHSPNRLLGGRSAIEMIREGEIAPVAAVVEQLVSGACL